MNSGKEFATDGAVIQNAVSTKWYLVRKVFEKCPKDQKSDVRR